MLKISLLNDLFILIRFEVLLEVPLFLIVVVVKLLSVLYVSFITFIVCPSDLLTQLVNV